MVPLDQGQAIDNDRDSDSETRIASVSRDEAEAAIQTLLIWAGDDP
jgi:hypothetical protein